jgi:hypothetical protein
MAEQRIGVKRGAKKQSTHAVTVENIPQQAATPRDTDRPTGRSTPTMPRSATSVTRCMSACPPCRCTYSLPTCTTSVSSVARPFQGPGCCRGTCDLTRETNHTAAWCARSPLPTDQTCEPTCRPIPAPKISNVPVVRNHLR